MTTEEAFFTGTTIRPTASFHDWSEEGEPIGDLIDPDTVSITTYDAEENIMETDVATRDSEGKYHFDWTLPLNPGTYCIEFKGVLDGEPVLIRKTYKVKFKI